MQILVRKYTAKPRFKPHYNSATGRYYGTAKEYTEDLKKKGLEPVKDLNEPSIKGKAYKPSAWARGMANEIQNARKADGSVDLGDRFKDELKKRGVSLKGDKK